VVATGPGTCPGCRCDRRCFRTRQACSAVDEEAADPIRLRWSCSLDVHLIDGTYELFRHYDALPSARDRDGREVAAVRGVLASVLGMIRNGATHLAVATDHVIESFRNGLCQVTRPAREHEHYFYGDRLAEDRVRVRRDSSGNLDSAAGIGKPCAIYRVVIVFTRVTYRNTGSCSAMRDIRRRAGCARIPSPRTALSRMRDAYPSPTRSSLRRRAVPRAPGPRPGHARCLGRDGRVCIHPLDFGCRHVEPPHCGAADRHEAPSLRTPNIVVGLPVF